MCIFIVRISWTLNISMGGGVIDQNGSLNTELFLTRSGLSKHSQFYPQSKYHYINVVLKANRNINVMSCLWVSKHKMNDSLSQLVTLKWLLTSQKGSQWQETMDTFNGSPGALRQTSLTCHLLHKPRQEVTSHESLIMQSKADVRKPSTEAYYKR